MIKSAKNRNTWDLIWQFFKTDFKLKYHDSVLGFLWVLLKPLAIFAVMYTVTSQVFSNGSIKYYSFYLLMGTILSTFWSEGTLAGLNSIRNKSGLILKVSFPRYIAVVSATLLPIINLIINLFIFFVLMIFFNKMETIPSILNLLWFGLSLIGLYIIIFGFSLFASILYVKFKDLQHIWELILSMTFWITPVVYNPDLILKNSHPYLKTFITEINPLSVFLVSARDSVLYSKISNPKLTFIWLGIGIVFVTVGYIYFKKAVRKIAEDF